MTEINEEMKTAAEFAINSAKVGYGLELNYSEDSLPVLNVILEKLYWTYFDHANEEKEGSLVYNTAIIWGAYLGEYMCRKWGGTWTVNGTDRTVSITSIVFSPISFVYQKITNHPEYSVENYVNEIKTVVYTSVIHPQKSQYLSEGVGQDEQEVSKRPPRKPINLDKRLIYGSAGFLSLLLIIFACIAGYKSIQAGSFGEFGIFSILSKTHTATPSPTITATATPRYTKTPTPTVTNLPTYTPKPSNTPQPSPTPSSTRTQFVSPTASPTQTPTPTRTRRPYVPVPTTEVPYHPPKQPTATEYVPPLPSIVSCQVSPNTVVAGVDTGLTYIVQFSYHSPGLGFTASPASPGTGCSASDNDSSGTAYCNGSSGFLTSGQSVSVSISSSVGGCGVSYSAP